MASKPPVIPGFRIIRALGSGSSGTVWFAEEERNAVKVALKVFSGEEACAARSFDEVRVLASIEHEHLVASRSSDLDHRPPWMAMEFAGGGSLARRLDSGPFPPDQALELLGEQFRALAYLHARGIVHRDIKPSNILFRSNGESMLGDFGLALWTGNAGTTMAGILVGTVAYMAPELLAGSTAHPGSDLFALGLCMYEAVTGRHPTDHRPVPSGWRCEDPAKRVPGCPDLLRVILLELLEPDPGRRPRRAMELADRLSAANRAALVPTAVSGVEISSGHPVEPSPPTRQASAPTPALPRHRRRLPVIFVSFCLATVTILVLTSRSPPAALVPVQVRDDPQARIAAEELELRRAVLGAVTEYQARARFVTDLELGSVLGETKRLENLSEVAPLLGGMIQDFTSCLDLVISSSAYRTDWLHLEEIGSIMLPALRPALRLESGAALLRTRLGALERTLQTTREDPLERAAILSLRSGLLLVREASSTVGRDRLRDLEKANEMLDLQPEDWKRSLPGLYHRIRFLDAQATAVRSEGKLLGERSPGASSTEARLLARILELARDLHRSGKYSPGFLISRGVFWTRMFQELSRLMDIPTVPEETRREVAYFGDLLWEQLITEGVEADPGLAPARARLLQGAERLGIATRSLAASREAPAPEDP